MIDWWGPIILEYYGATEGLGFTACDSEEWLAHTGTVGRVVLGELHILDEDMQRACRLARPGTIWFKTATPFEYFNDPERTQERDLARRHDEHGRRHRLRRRATAILYLTDRKTFMIISGGVNIYPQECENLLITHPKVADAAVFGVPNADLGEEVKAVVQLDARHRAGRGDRGGTARVLRRAPVAAEGAALDRLRGRAAAPADGQALQAAAARSLLDRPLATSA